MCLFLVYQTNASNAFEPSSKESAVSNFSFVLFYRQSCPHCQRFGPVLAEYARAHQLPVLSVNVDEPEFLAWQSIFLSDQKKVVPKLFLINRAQQTIFEVSIGDLSNTELSFRMRTLITKIQDYERNGV